MTLIAYLRIGFCAALLAAVGGWSYRHGIEVQAGRTAETELASLRVQIAADAAAMKLEREKSDGATDAMQALDESITNATARLGRLPGGCVPTPERLRVLQDATNAANATGFSSHVPGPAGAAKR